MFLFFNLESQLHYLYGAPECLKGVSKQNVLFLLLSSSNCHWKAICFVTTAQSFIEASLGRLVITGLNDDRFVW